MSCHALNSSLHHFTQIEFEHFIFFFFWKHFIWLNWKTNFVIELNFNWFQFFFLHFCRCCADKLTTPIKTDTWTMCDFNKNKMSTYRRSHWITKKKTKFKKIQKKIYWKRWNKINRNKRRQRKKTKVKLNQFEEADKKKQQKNTKKKKRKNKQTTKNKKKNRFFFGFCMCGIIHLQGSSTKQQQK